MQLRICGILLCLLLSCAANANAKYLKAAATVSANALSLSNSDFSVTWSFSGNKLGGGKVENRMNLCGCGDNPDRAVLTRAFALRMADGTVLSPSDLVLVAGPRIEELKAVRTAAREAERFAGKQIVLELATGDHRLHFTWRAVLHDGSDYAREELTITASGTDACITEIRMLELSVPDAKVAGTVRGSPVVGRGFFAGLEHPLSACKVDGEDAQCSVGRELPLKAGQQVTYSSVVGAVHEGNTRRMFLGYIERERAHPYRPFLHYNSWYDIGYFSKYDEAAALNVIDAFGNELTRKRGVKLDSFLFDDGWDDPTTLWAFHSGFPHGFTPLTKEAAKFNAAPGVWMSPWGGYGKPRDERLKYGKEAGFEIVDHGFALSGPKYYERFRATMLDMVRKYHVNQFKIDGTGNANRVFPGSRFDSDFDAAISLISELRAVKPDIYINLTTGTYPSPFWLRYADSIWRGGEDHSFAGVGSHRQQWITYRDADVYEHVVKAGPLYPLNSLMLHGLIYARHAKNLDSDPNDDFADEVHDYFGTGTQLQEMYITPALLSQENWDTLAEAAKWARANADVLVDTHWIGGDPAKLEVYGWASWSPKKAILVLRNPSDRPQSFAVNALRAFELPIGFPDYVAHSPWKVDRHKPSVKLPAQGEHTFELKPFQVLVLDAVPER